jgi:capsid protein
VICLRARARQIVRSNPYASNAADSFVANAVGAGIVPSSLIADTALKDEVQRVWLAWTDEVDADGLTDFYGLQALAARAMFEAGECFVRFPSPPSAKTV